jgi:hypothetical protein
MDTAGTSQHAEAQDAGRAQTVTSPVNRLRATTTNRARAVDVLLAEAVGVPALSHADANLWNLVRV